MLHLCSGRLSVTMTPDRLVLCAANNIPASTCSGRTERSCDFSQATLMLDAGRANRKGCLSWPASAPANEMREADGHVEDLLLKTQRTLNVTQPMHCGPLCSESANMCCGQTRAAAQPHEAALRCIVAYVFLTKKVHHEHVFEDLGYCPNEPGP
jgi:hypothetical protein